MHVPLAEHKCLHVWHLVQFLWLTRDGPPSDRSRYYCSTRYKGAFAIEYNYGVLQSSLERRVRHPIGPHVKQSIHVHSKTDRTL